MECGGPAGAVLTVNVTLFTSRNLREWTNHGPVFQAAQSGLTDPVLFCPKVLFDRRANTWVMWFNPILGADFTVSYYAIATSPSPLGPFVLVSRNVTSLAYQNVGDFNLFQDEDGTAYVIYTAHITTASKDNVHTHFMSVERLTDDYLSTEGAAGNSGFFGDEYVEAPALFRRQVAGCLLQALCWICDFGVCGQECKVYMGASCLVSGYILRCLWAVLLLLSERQPGEGIHGISAAWPVHTAGFHRRSLARSQPEHSCLPARSRCLARCRHER